jgi:alginate O-acetyltransferase complex protein AlgI
VIVFLLCGLWHGASWPFVLWGAWHGAFLVAERAWLDRVLKRSQALAHIYALLVVIGGWVLFRCETLTQATAYYAALLGNAQGDPLRRPLAEFADPLVLGALSIGVLFATPLAPRIGRWRDRVAAAGGLQGRTVLAADMAWLGVVFAAAAAFLAAGTYNPFIYFRF